METENMGKGVRIRPRDRDSILRALRSGVTPRNGLRYIQVGRYGELRSFLKDIENVADGGSSFRLVIGEYGSGKTFFLSLVRAMAMEKGLVTMHADLSPAKRLSGRQGQARVLMEDLVASLATRTRPDGNALTLVLERFVDVARRHADGHAISLAKAIRTLLRPLEEYPGGAPFAKMVEIYCHAYDCDNALQADAALRWLRAGYTTRTDAARQTGVREILDGSSLFDTLALYAGLVRAAGYKGLYVCLDEMVNLYKIVNTTARRANYEEILHMLNSTLQGTVAGLGIVMGGTPEFLTDPMRGLYSYEALRSRLAENSFGTILGLDDHDGTVLRLPNLTPGEMRLLVDNINLLYATGRDDLTPLPDEALDAYLKHCYSKIGESYFRTPRNTIKGFVDLLSMLEQHPDRDWRELMDQVPVEQEHAQGALPQVPESGADGADEEFAGFSL